MAEIFKEAEYFNQHPQRWNHDLSHKHYGSYKAGRIYPVFTHLMAPTDSIDLDTAALLQFMPMPTPLQSNVRVIFHAFFNRMKNLHEDWPNTIQMLEEHELPWIQPSVKELEAGSLHDYLDLNVNVVVNGQQDFVRRYLYDRSQKPIVEVTSDGNIVGSFEDGHSFNGVLEKDGLLLFSAPSRVAPAVDANAPFSGLVTFKIGRLPFKVSSTSKYSVSLRLSLSPDPILMPLFDAPCQMVSSPAKITVLDADYYDIPFVSTDVSTALDALGFDGSQYIHMDLCFFPEGGATKIVNIASQGEYVHNRVVFPFYNVTQNFYVFGSYSYAQFPDRCPYSTKEFPDAPLRIHAWRHRTYEANYNAFYRNIHGNQPFIVDGVTKYNQYNTTRASGLDMTDYHFFNRNWELDAYTSALASPQQGSQPLVGISSLGRLTLVDDDGTTSTAQLVDLPQGQQGVGITEMNAATNQHRSIMMNLASSGISINDLRETNALQKFLEINIRKGFRYIDFIMGHFGKAPKRVEMDMPEFIGGFSVKLDVGKVTNTNMAAEATDPNAVLGQFAGSGQAFGGSKRSMRYYADDFGYFQVLMMIVPDAAYSQIVPKDLLYNDPLDYPFPDFSNLSYQPITYEEFCPGECFADMQADPSKQLTDVFGYQRPQYERVWLPDRIHGQFLTSMNNYVVNRIFEHRPELGNDFFQIKPEDMSRNFTVMKGDNDIAFGQIAFRITYKQAVPRVAIPSIGR